MDKERISLILHNMMSEFRVNMGQEPYPIWITLDESVKQLYYGAIDRVTSGEITTPEQIHDYWMEWAKTNKSDHSCIIPFEGLSGPEKAKDELVLHMIRIFNTYL
jgi:hypothetical protein